MEHKSCYKCIICNCSMRKECYSKTQVNKLLHNKIVGMKCLECAKSEVNINSDSTPPSSKRKRTTESIDHSHDNSHGNNDDKLNSVFKVADPSLKYINNPTNTPLIKDATAFAARYDLEYKIYLSKVVHWRTVVKMAVRSVFSKGRKSTNKNKKNSKHSRSLNTSIGLFKPGTHDVIPCVNSAAHHPAINKVLILIDNARKKVGVEGYMEGTGDDVEQCHKMNTYLKYLVLVLARSSEKVQISIVWNDCPNSSASHGTILLHRFIDCILELATEVDIVHSIWVNYNLSSRYCNAITGREQDSWQLKWGPEWIEESVATDMEHPPILYFPPFVFRQANICAFTHIIVNIRKWIHSMITTENKNNSDSSHHIGIRCVELYGGVGTIGLNCVDLLDFLTCSDENPHNMKCFEQSRQLMHNKFSTKVGKYDPRAAAAVATGGGMQGYDLVLVDPPRKGLDDEVIDELTKAPQNGFTNVSKKKYFCADNDDEMNSSGDQANGKYNKYLIYVSCGFKAFQRDAARLIGEDQLHSQSRSGQFTGMNNNSSARRLYWELVHLEGHVLFPGSDHIETLAIFNRLPPNN